MIINFIKKIWAVLLFLLAIIGFLVPIIPGTLFLILAIAAFSPEHGKKIKDWLKKKAKKAAK
jgi:uncharacterized membrane protein YbaN (DUF454 family)